MPTMLINFKFLFFIVIFKMFNTHDVCETDDIHALILARGGSKGIHLKNLIELNGLSLLAKTITTIQKSKLFVATWVSTDSIQIANEAKKYGASVHRRPALFAQDQTSSLDSVKEFLNSHPTIKRFALFQCTSVFLNIYYISEAVKKYQYVDCVFSVKRSYKLRWRDIGGKIEPINFDPSNRPRRQDWSGELVETGMFYFSTRKLIAENHFQHERCDVVEINPLDSLEINTIEDVQLARCILSYKSTQL